MREVVRAAAYLPTARSAQGASVAADEDEFTISATAIERAWAGRRVMPGPVEVHLFGEFPPVADWGVSALLGEEAGVVRHAPKWTEFASVLGAAEEGEGGPLFLVAAEIPGRAGDRKPTAPGPITGAVALLLEPSSEKGSFIVPKTPVGRSIVATLLRVGRSGKGLPRSVTLSGDWDRAPDGPGPPKASESPRTQVEPVLASVSEGAYVPRPRYIENLPSRWRFLAEVCNACRGTTFPARGICRRCGRKDSLVPLSLPYDDGRVVAVTTIGRGGQPTEFDAQVESLGPYDVALVELARGMRVTLQVTDARAGALQVGDRVNTRLRRLYPMEGEWRYGRKAVPAATAPTHPSAD